MGDQSFSDSVDKVKDRKSATQRLIEAVAVSEAENHFLHMAVQQKDTWAGTTLTFYSSKLLEVALAKHAEALVRSAEASERNASSLTKATWVLAAATIILAGATIALLIRPGI